MNVTCIVYFRLSLAPNIAVELLTLLLQNREVTARMSILGLTMLVEIFCSFPQFLPRSFHLISPFINCHITQH